MDLLLRARSRMRRRARTMREAERAEASLEVRMETIIKH